MNYTQQKGMLSVIGGSLIQKGISRGDKELRIKVESTFNRQTSSRVKR